jgi:hypothetical protein
MQSEKSLNHAQPVLGITDRVHGRAFLLLLTLLALHVSGETSNI